MKRTLVTRFLEQVRLFGHRPALREKQAGRWVTMTWQEWGAASQAIAAALVDAGLPAGGRVVVAARTRRAWAEIDMGVMLAGGVTVPVYPTLTGAQAGHVVTDSGAAFAFVDDPVVAARFARAGALAAMQLVVAIDERGIQDGSDPEGRPVLHLADVPGDAPLVSLRELALRGQRALSAGAAYPLDARASAVEPDSLATITYTSGTGGAPKGVMLTHAAFAAEILALRERMDLGPQDEQLLFLPLAHVFGRLMLLAQLEVGYITSFTESAASTIAELPEVEPTFVAGPPRLFEQIQAEVLRRARADGEIRGRVFSWALGIGHDVLARRRAGSVVSLGLGAAHRYADKLVLSRVRASFGRRFRFAFSGGAPLSPELGDWFLACGVPIFEGYGLTETTSATHVNAGPLPDFRNVGLPLPCVEQRIAEDGEILVRGPTIMRGYWGNEAASREVLSDDGWLHTGDLGAIDTRGALSIVGRKKDVIVTSTGRAVAPQNVEALLTRSDYVSHAVVYGDRRSHLVALLVVDPAALAKWVREQGRSLEPSELVHDPDVRALLQREVDGVNARLAKDESIVRFAVLDRPLTSDLGELTPSAKVRRRAVVERHRALFESLYEDDA